MNAAHPIFQPLLGYLAGEAPRTRKFMVQVWDHYRAPGAREFKSAWTDYWPVEATDMKGARERARKALSPFWLAKRWRVIQQDTERAVADSAPHAAASSPEASRQCLRGKHS